MKKIRARVLGYAIAMAATGCMTDVEGAAPDEATSSVQQAITTHQKGWAWVQASGVIGGSWVLPGGVTATKVTTGHYSVSFTGGAVVNPHVQVVAYGSGNTHCKVGEAGGHSWLVFCFNGAGAWTDSAFTIVMSDFSGTDLSQRGAYLRSSATGIVTRPWNSTGGTNTVTWSAADQEYTVTMPGMPTANASVHVTADGAIYYRCKVRQWSLGQVKVKCFNATGGAVQSQFYVSYHEFTKFGMHIGGHSWVNAGSPSPSYTRALSSISCFAPEPFATTPSGLDLTVKLPDPHYPPAGWWDFVPMVTGYGNNANYCKVVGWSSTGSAYNATVRCFDAVGTQINASSVAFTLTFTSNRYPGPC
jgi:hypothetical protein